MPPLLTSYLLKDDHARRGALQPEPRPSLLGDLPEETREAPSEDPPGILDDQENAWSAPLYYLKLNHENRHRLKVRASQHC